MFLNFFIESDLFIFVFFQKVKNIIIALVDRLAASHDVVLPDDLFEIFSSQISHIITSRPSISIEDIIIMQGSLINFSLKKISNESEREASVNSVLAATLKAIQDMNIVTINLRTNLGKEMFRFLKLPFNLSNAASLAASIDGSNVGNSGGSEYGGLIKMSLKLTNYKDLLKQCADIELHKQIILTLITATLENYSEDSMRPQDRLTLVEIETFLTQLCAPLVNGTNHVMVGSGQANGGQEYFTASTVIDDQDEDFIDEQLLLARFIHFLLLPQCIQSDLNNQELHCIAQDTIQLLDTTYLTLNSARKILSTGGPSRIRYTYPALVFEALQLALRWAIFLFGMYVTLNYFIDTPN